MSAVGFKGQDDQACQFDDNELIVIALIKH